MIVSHSSAIKAILEGFDKEFKAEEEPANGSISVMSLEGGVYTVKGFNLFELGKDL